jgi:GT2 family glycosyltransferase
MSSPAISVVIPTYQRAALLDRCLEALRNAEDAEDVEVIVVDDGSTDRTPEILRSHAWVRSLVQQRNQGPAAARNRGVREARAPLVLFLDDDIVVTPELVGTHLRLHREAADEQLCVLGRVDWHPDLRVTPFMRWLDTSGLQFGYQTWLREGPVDPPYAAFYTANLSIRRHLVVDAGGFDERFPFPAYEDMELAFRLTKTGLRMRYCPAALAYHSRQIDLAAFRRRMAMVGTSAALLRAAAPDFPLDDRELLARDRRRRERLRLALRAAITRTAGARAEHYWAQIGHAYAAASRSLAS